MTGRILVAGIGNIFLGDDGFGVEVVRRLARRPLPDGVEVVDYGIRGMDLAYALLDGHDVVIFVDAAPRGGTPGTLYLIEPRLDADSEVTIDTHGMDPVNVLRFARELGARPTRTFVVACEPRVVIDGGNAVDVLVELSEPVRAAVGEAVEMVEALVEEICRGKARAGVAP
ncbi:MAG: hydrogenase maturation protease [Chloroflexi bacterium]|nr:hydrogenase maturation protease [Chloroflexota bacterium]